MTKKFVSVMVMAGRFFPSDHACQQASIVRRLLVFDGLGNVLQERETHSLPRCGCNCGCCGSVGTKSRSCSPNTLTASRIQIRDLSPPSFVMTRSHLVEKYGGAHFLWACAYDCFVARTTTHDHSGDASLPRRPRALRWMYGTRCWQLSQGWRALRGL
jgi:hypothetical protein